MDKMYPFFSKFQVLEGNLMVCLKSSQTVQGAEHPHPSHSVPFLFYLPNRHDCFLLFCLPAYLEYNLHESDVFPEDRLYPEYLTQCWVH